MSIVPTNGAAVVQMHSDELDTLRRTIGHDLDPNEFELFAAICRRTGLDPFARQIYAVKRWDSRQKKDVMQIQTGIDGLRLIAERSQHYAGQTPAEWCGPDGVWVDVWLADGPPAAARVGVIRDDFREPVYAVAKFSSYCATTKDGQPMAMWRTMPEVMIAKCAEALAIRKAFPNDVSGVYTREEMAQQHNADGPPLASPEQVDKIDSLLPVVPDAAMPALKAWKAEQAISMKAGEFTADAADAVIAKLEELAEVSGGGEPSSPPAAAPGVRTGGEEIGGASLVDPANPCTDPSGVSPAPDRQAPAATTTVEPDTLLGDEVGTAPPAGTAPGGGKNVTGGGPVPPTATPSGGTPTAAVLLSATGKTAGSAVVALKRAAAEVDPAGPFMADEIEAVPEFAARVLAHLGGMPLDGDPKSTFTKKQNGWIHAVWANHGGDNARKAYLSQLTSGRTDSSGELTAAEKKAYLAKTEEMS